MGIYVVNDVLPPYFAERLYLDSLMKLIEKAGTNEERTHPTKYNGKTLITRSE